MSPTELQAAIQALLSQQAANGGANADPVFAQELAKAGYGSNLPSMGGVGDIGIAGPNTGTITMPDGSKQIINYYVGGTNVGEYRTDDQGNVYSTSGAGDTNRIKPTGMGFVGDNQSAYITPRGGGEAVMTPPPTNNGNESWLEGLMSLAPVVLPAIMGAYAGGSFGGAGDTFTAAGEGAGAGGTLTSTVTPVADGFGAGAGPDIYGYTSQYNPAVDYAAQAGGAGGGMTGNQLGLYQMGQEMGLSGPALDNWVATGGGATIAGGAAGAAAGGGIGNALMNAAGKFVTGNAGPLLGAGLSTAGALYGANQIGKSAAGAANTLGAANTNAANLASNASLAATNLQREQFQRQQELQQPFYNAGVNALPAYASGVMPGGDLVRPFSVNDWLANQDPARQLIMDEMGRATLHQAAAGTGGLSGVFSGNTAKALQDRAGQQTNKFYTDAYNRYVNDQATRRNALAGLTGYGPTSASTIGAAGQNYASNVGNLGMTTANTIGGMDLSLAGGINNANMTSAAARQSAYGGAANAFNAAINPDPLNAFLARSLRTG
jgi:hypothetical protein